MTEYKSTSTKTSLRKKWLLGVFFLVVVSILLIPAWLSFRDELARRTCASNLQQIANALQQSHAKYGSFPPAYMLGSNGNRLHSWRVLLLPFLAEEALYQQLKLDEPWDSPHNRKVASRFETPSVYRCPKDQHSAGSTSYLAVVGKETIWPQHYSASVEDIFDMAEHTIQVIEAEHSGIHWIEPRDISFQEALTGLDGREKNLSKNKLEPSPGHFHAEVFRLRSSRGMFISLASKFIERLGNEC